MTQPRFQGIIAALVTPFDARGRIAYKIYGNLIDHVVAQKASAIVPASFSGEFFSLSLDERCELLRFAVRHANSRIGVIASTFSPNVEETVALCNLAADLHCQAALVAAPLVVNLSAQEIVTYFNWIDDTVRLPVIAYNYPARFGTDLTPQILERVQPAKHLVAYKDTSGLLSRLQEFSTILADRYELICGYDDLAVESYIWGARAILGGSACFLGRIHDSILRAALTKNGVPAAIATTKKLLPLLNVMGSGKYIQLCRLGCELSGIQVGCSRRPLTPLTTNEIREFRAAWESLAG